jgi:hypothetical protein
MCVAAYKVRPRKNHRGVDLISSQQGNRHVLLSQMNYPNKMQSRPSLAANQPVFGVPVPNYNTQRPRVQTKKSWWRWEFLQRWHKVKGGNGVKSESKPTIGGAGAAATRGSQ